MKGKLKINFHIKPYLFFEIRYVMPKFGGSYPLIGGYAGRQGVGMVLYPFILQINIMRRLKPAPLTEEDKKALEELNENDQASSKQD